MTNECRARYEFYAAGSKHNDLAQYLKWNDWWWDKNRREPVFFAVAFCIADKIYNPITGAQLGMAKQDLGFLICCVDTIIVFLLICTINLFNIRYREYIQVFDKTNIEMRDFTVVVENLPFDYQYGGKDIIL